MAIIFSLYFGYSLLVRGNIVFGLVILGAPSAVILQMWRSQYQIVKLRELNHSPSALLSTARFLSFGAVALITLPIGVSFTSETDWDTYLTNTVPLMVFLACLLSVISWILLKLGAKQIISS